MKVGVIDRLDVWDLASAQTGPTNMIRNAPQTSVDRGFCRRDLTENGRWCMLRSDQKIISLMKQLLTNFSKPDNLVFDSSEGTGFTATELQGLAKQRFVRCDKFSGA